MKRIILIIAILITSSLHAQLQQLGTTTLNRGAKGDTGTGGTSNANIFIPTLSTDFTSPNAANIGKIWELQTEIDLGGAVVDLSTYNITLKDGGGKLTNFTSIDLGDFRTDGNPNAVYFDQSAPTTEIRLVPGPSPGTTGAYPKSITGQCLDEVVYVGWFGLNKNADLMVGGSLNGALPDHVAIQNAINVTPKQNGTLAFPVGAKILQGDGTNGDYTYTVPYSGAGNVSPSGNAWLGVMQMFYFLDYDNLTILGNGSTIIAHPDQTNINANGGFNFKLCDDLYIENLTYNGNLVQRDPYFIDINPFHINIGFNIIGCINPILVRLIATDCVMDGFYIGAVEGVIGDGGEMRDCKALYNYRQGMSVVGHNRMKVYNSTFSFTGRRISTTGTADGRLLTTSPSAGIDMEGEEQSNWHYEGCRFEGNRGAGLAFHWGTYNSVCTNSVFIDDSLFEPQDTRYWVNGNNTYTYNTFINSDARSEAGGVHFLGNIFYIDDYIKLYNLDGTVGSQNGASPQYLFVEDLLGYYDLGYTRKSDVSKNYFYVDITNDNIYDEAAPEFLGASFGRISISIGGLIFENNTMVNCIGTQIGGTDGDVGSIGGKGMQINNNKWQVASAAKTKFPNGIGRFNFSQYFKSFSNNLIDQDYGSLSNFNIFSSNTGVELRGSYAKFSSNGETIDGDDAFEIYVPNANGDVKITIVGGTGLGNSVQETWLSTYDVTLRRNGYVNGAIDATWGFIDPITGTNPRTGATGYKIVCAHDVAGNVDYKGQITVEWFGQNGTPYNEEEFLIYRNASYGTVTGLKRVYDGGLRGTTANIPTTGGVGNYTGINVGANYYDTTTNTMKYWDGAAFN